MSEEADKQDDLIEDWDSLLECISLALNDNAPEQTKKNALEQWLKHVVGRFADGGEHQAPFMLWEFIDPISADQRLSYSQFLDDRLPRDIEQLASFAQLLFERHKLKNELTFGAACLLRGAAAVVSAVLNLSANQKTPLEWLHEAALQYARFWSGNGEGEIASIDLKSNQNDDLIAIAMVELARPIGSFTSVSRQLLSEYHQRIGWQMVYSALCWWAQSTSHKSDHMTLVFQWEPERNNESPHGAHAELVIQYLPHDLSLGSVFSPDPIALGIVPIDSKWRISFDHAASWVKQHTTDRQPAGFRNCTWKLEYSHYEKSLRYLALQGPSASAAAAMVLRAINTPNVSIDQQYVITAKVEFEKGQYSLGHVGGTSAKVWQDRVERKSVFVTCGEANELIDRQGIDFYRSKSAFNDAATKLRVRHEPLCSLEDAFELVTGGTQLLRDFLAEQRRQMASRIRRLLPSRLAKADAAGKGTLDEIFELHVEPQAISKRDLLELRKKQSEAQAAPDLDEQSMDTTSPEAARYAPPILMLDKDESIRNLAKPVGTMLDYWLGMRNSGDALHERYIEQTPMVEEPKQPYTQWSQDHQKIKILVGGVGTGKTWNTIYTVHRLGKCTEELGGDLQSWLPIWVTANELEGFLVDGQNRKRSNPEVILAILKHRLINGTTALKQRSYCDEEIESYLHAWWNRDRVLLVIDSWDEASNTDMLKTFVDSYQSHRPVIVSTRPDRFDKDMETSHGWEMTALEAPLPDLQDFIEKWFKYDKVHGKTLLERVERNVPLSQMMRMPLLATLVCILAEDSNENDLNVLPYQRSKLLERVLANLLLRAARDGKVDGTKLEKDALDKWLPFVMESLSQVAYATFDGERWRLSENDLLHIAEAIAARPEFREVGTSKKSIISILTGRIGLFTKTDDGQWEILHQYFAEYLVAKHLAEQIANKISIDQWASYLRSHVSFRILDSRWKEVWRLAGGVMNKESRATFQAWLRTLVREARFFQNVSCSLPREVEVYSENTSYIQSLIMAVAIEAEDVERLLNLIRNGHYVQGLNECDPTKIVSPLLNLLKNNKNYRTRLATTDAIGQFGSNAREAVDTLILILKQGNAVLQLRAAEALGQINSDTLSAVAVLIEFLESDEKWLVGAKGLKSFGLHALDGLIDLLIRTPNDLARREALKLIGAMGASAAKAIPDVASVMWISSSRETRYESFITLSKIGSQSDLVRIGLRAFCQSSGESWHEGILNNKNDSLEVALIDLLQTKIKFESRCCITFALGELCTGTPSTIDRLIGLLHISQPPETKWHVAYILEKCGRRAATATDALIDVIDSDAIKEAKHAAALALVRGGSTSERVTAALLRFFASSSSNNLAGVINALGQRGASAISIAPVLIPLLDNDFCRESIMTAMEHILSHNSTVQSLIIEKARIYLRRRSALRIKPRINRARRFRILKESKSSHAARSVIANACQVRHPLWLEGRNSTFSLLHIVAGESQTYLVSLNTCSLSTPLELAFEIKWQSKV